MGAAMGFDVILAHRRTLGHHHMRGEPFSDGRRYLTAPSPPNLRDRISRRAG